MKLQDVNKTIVESSIIFISIFATIGLLIVQPHKTADKKPRVLKALGHPYDYGYGRIQITLPKELIGIKAKIHMEFPNAPDIKVRHRRGRLQFDYYQIDGGGHFSKREDKVKRKIENVSP